MSDLIEGNAPTTARMTYREIAEAMGLSSADVARMKAKRRGWKRIPGNHPRDIVLVEVPLECLSERTEQNTSDRSASITHKRSASSAPTVDFEAMAGWQAAIDTQDREIQHLRELLKHGAAERVEYEANAREERAKLTALLSEAVENVGRVSARMEAVEGERDSALQSLGELKKLAAMLMDKIQGADAAKAEALQAVEDLRRSTAKTLIGMQAALRPPKPTA